MLRFLTSGESHGKALVAILDGLVAHIKLSEEDINRELLRRKQGVGRGGRMKLETDQCEILSGVRLGKTIGSPISILIKNQAREKWEEPFYALRPGHADLPGALKYNQKDLRDILERSSARETAVRVAVGAICKKFLSEFSISILSSVIHIGGKTNTIEIQNAIDKAQADGDTLGGVFEIRIENVPPGLGSFMQWDERLNASLAQAITSIPAIKGFEVGLGFQSAKLPGSKVHDEIFYQSSGKRGGKGTFFRKTNHAGGIEGGISNGEAIVIRAAMKPISTLLSPLQSVDMKSKKPARAHFERSDICAVHAAAVIGEAMSAFVIARALLAKFGGDSIEETMENYSSFKTRVSML